MCLCFCFTIYKYKYNEKQQLKLHICQVYNTTPGERDDGQDD